MKRNEFLEYARKTLSDLSGLVEEALLSTETRRGKASQYFIVTHVVSATDDIWEWSKQNLSDQPICYYSNEQANSEWWGFANEKDAFIWSTRWL